MRMFVFDVDDSLLSVKNWPHTKQENIAVWPVASSADYMAGWAWLTARLSLFDLLVLDTSSQLQAIYHDEVQKSKQWAKDPRQEWQQTLNWCEWLARSHRHLPLHVLWTAHEVEKEDQVARTRIFRPSFRGAFGVEHDKHFALVARLTLFGIPQIGADGRPTGVVDYQRWLNCHRDPENAAKDRSGTLSKWEVPDIDALFAKMAQSQNSGDLL